ncbi:MAG: enoyl-CoA hydratase/isomerase family protein [Dehalococcoidia bacterium]|nr:enoyl-CoA hydratase/isomerase family protein [Dehalococcoidia bacterium]
MAKFKLELKDRVAIVTMAEDDNKLNTGMCSGLLDMLDEIEKETGALTMVVTSAHDRTWCYGFDTDWIDARMAEGNKEAVTQFLTVDIALRKRLLAYPLITIAAINGHAFGGGAILSLCFDFRFMRLDRGYFCIPAVDRGYSILPGTGALLKNVPPLHLGEEAVLTGRRIPSVECAEKHLAAGTYNSDELMDRVMDFAGALNKDRQIVGHMKKVLNGDIVKLMEDDVQYIQGGKMLV